LIEKKAYTMNEFATTLGLTDKTRGEKERTDRSLITIERIAACYAEETQEYLTRNLSMSKIKDLGNLGFTKSFFCRVVRDDIKVTKKVYKGYLKFAKVWKGGGNPKRFAEKMKVYYTTILDFSPELFEEVERDVRLEGRRENDINNTRGVDYPGREIVDFI